MRHLNAKLRSGLAAAAAGLLLAATLVPPDADARAGRGGSFGSRGSKTWSAPPPTATAPGAQQMQRSTTQPGSTFGNPGPAATQAAQRPGMFSRGGMFGGFAGGLMAGLLGAGLFGLLSGSGLFGGLGSMASFIGLLIQAAIVFFIVKLALNWWRNRQQPQAAAASGPSGYRFDAPEPRGAEGLGYGANRSALGAAAGGGGSFGQSGAVELDKADFDAFERMLGEVQDAWSNQDVSRLRGLATPEMVEAFAGDLADDASRGVVNKVTNVKLLQGDLAEAWRENGRAFATVAMRYELTDVTQDRDTGRVVDGDPERTEEATELWTFLKAGTEGRWILSAIQQAA